MKKTHLLLLVGLLAALAGLIAVLLRPWGSDAPPGNPGAHSGPGAPHGSKGGEAADLPRTPDATTGGFYRIPVGTELRFRLVVTQGMTLGSRDGTQPERSASEMKGEFVMAVLERSRDEIVLEVTMPGLTASTLPTGAAISDGTFLADLARSAFVRMRDDGTILGIDFAPAVNHKVPNWLRSLLAAARFAVLTDRTDWTRTEVDATGLAETGYSWQQPLQEGRGIVVKHKQRYLPAQVDESAGGGSGEQQVNRVPEGGGKGTAVLDADLGWYTHVDYSERLQLEIPEAGYTVVSDYALTMTLASRRVRDRLIAVGSRSWQGMDGREAARQSAALEQAEQEKAEAGQLSVPALLQDLDLAVQAADADSFAKARAMRSLALLLQHRPATVSELSNLLAAGGLEQDTIALALVAAAEAGTPQAQDMIASLLADGASGPMGRAALASVFAIAAPGPVILERVAALANAADPQLASAGLLALGCAAGRQTEAARVAAVDLLRAARPRTAEGLSAWLYALGNSGLPECIELSEPYRHGSDVGLRADAMVALRRVQGAPVLAVLRAAATGDPEPEVRRSAVAALAERPGTDSVPILSQVLDRETDRATLESAIDLLRRCLPETVASDLLTRTAAAHPIPDVRQWAAAALASRR